MAEELRACPFCGREEEVFSYGDYGRDNEYVACGCIYGDSTLIDIESWNTRPIEDALRAELAEATEFCRKSNDIAKEYIADLARKDALIEVLEELVRAHDEYLLAADDVAVIKWDCVAGHPVSDELRQHLQAAYEQRETARARLAEVRGEPCPK